MGTDCVGSLPPVVGGGSVERQSGRAIERREKSFRVPEDEEFDHPRAGLPGERLLQA